MPFIGKSPALGAVGADSVTAGSIVDDAVGADQLASNAVVTASIVNDNVTADKIVDDIALAGNITTTGTLAPTGVLTADAGVVVDNITIDGTEIDLSSGDLTIDVAGDIILDADGADWILKDAGTTIMQITNNSGSTELFNSTSDGDILFKGNDGGATITALTLDMSAAGAATFNDNITAYSDRRLKDNIETLDGSKVYDMRGVSFTREDREGSGVIAQELQEIAPELVHDDGKYLSVAYGNLVGYLIEAVKDLKAEIEELKNGSSE
jgi:hypothetical protein